MSNKPNFIIDFLDEASDVVVAGIIEVWFLITIGLLTVLWFFGRKTVSRWEKVVKSHMPSATIEAHIKKVYDDMSECQRELKNEVSQVNKNISEVHSRVDDILLILITKKKEEE